ncbi:protein GPR107 isoform X2 [Harpegnathos saltator]|uniref:protein GPR107 isoform X2 n=1 Tax=Harpegnathos saltator TaxID=610380 RepID=UPI00058FC4C4|nr:protein GPR107 isoform X2 [Harpegnathos saltator]
MQPNAIALARCLLLLLLMVAAASARIHKLDIRKDNRPYIALTTFGFYKGGILIVNLTNFQFQSVDPDKKLTSETTDKAVFGFSLDRTLIDAINPYIYNHLERCLLQNATTPRTEPRDDSSIIYFTMDLKNLVMHVNCSRNVRTTHIYKDSSRILIFRTKRDSLPARLSDTALFPRRKRNTSHELAKPISGDDANGGGSKSNTCCRLKLPMMVNNHANGRKSYNTSFVMYVANEEEEGLYNLYFHNCLNYNYEAPLSVDFTMQIAEINNDNFLSAGEMPLPALYFTMALLFFLSGCFWVFILAKSKRSVFRIHYLMAVLVYLKSLSLLFHGINYHFIQTKGEHVEAWAILYYISHLLKGAVLFITMVLVGTGWTFIKHILSDKEKKFFMLVIPLQVLANVAEIIIEESEVGNLEHQTWRDIFILVDLLCCGAIIFPVVWSIKHLEEAARTSDKAAITLRKLKLFKHFYIMIVCYIYFTRIIMYLLKITVRFEYQWLDETFREMATYVFFVLTGYKFRPASTNPYFTVPSDEVRLDDDDDDDRMDVVVSGNGLTKDFSKVSKVPRAVRPLSGKVPSTAEERHIILYQKTDSS